MAGGIDWFRWHHGTVTDQKFPLVARRAGATVAEVIAVWACLLERASMNEDERGWLGESLDFEAMDCALGLADGRAQAIFSALQQRSLVDDGMRVSAWSARQPKRERQDDNSTERSRAFRDKQRQATPESGNATPCNATQRTETPRGEERREEKNNTSPLRSEVLAAKAAETAAAVAAPTPTARGSRLPADWQLPAAWRDWALSELRGWTLDTARLEAAKFADFWHAKTGKDASKADWQATWRNWCRNARMPTHGPPSDRRSRQLETASALTGCAPPKDFIDMEAPSARRLSA